MIRALHTFSDDFAKSLNGQYVARWTRRRRWFPWFTPQRATHQWTPVIVLHVELT